jgi:hypothetical protein
MVLGCGGPDDTMLAMNGFLRIEAVVAARRRKEISATILTGPPVFIDLADRSLRTFGLRTIYRPESFEDYTGDSWGDLIQGFRLARANGISEVLIVTEDAHFRYRIKPFAEKLCGEIRFRHLSSGKGDLLSRMKEYGAHILLTRLGGREGKLYRRLRWISKFLAERRFLPKSLRGR